MPYEKLRVLIWGKTYPELSSKYVETVCTGGVREDGTPVRLYPVPLRYLDTGQRYELYDWIEAPVEKSSSDPRPESFKVDSHHISRVGHIDPKGSWAARRDFIFKDLSWQFGSVRDLKEAQRRTQRSLGIVHPGTVEDVRLVPKGAQERAEYESKLAEIQSQQDLFHPQYKELEFLTHDIKLRWRCLDSCPECKNRPHDMKALDWGLLELARREGWVKAEKKLEEISDLRTHDFRIFMGNFRLHSHIFGIIGMWYPKVQLQTSLPLRNS